MDITKAESYLYDRLEMLSDEKVLLITKLNKIQIEIEETDNMITSMAQDVDTAFEVFSPRPKRNDFAKEGIAKLNKRKEELKLLKKDGCIMHPLPRRDEIATCCDRDPRAMYWRQMRNGMWIRAALIASVFGYEKPIMDCGY